MFKFCIAVFTALAAIAAPPAFEVSSVKINKAGSAGGEGKTREKIDHSPVGLTMTNITLNSCVKWAYMVRDFQIAGAPAWFTSDRYDIAAKASSPVSEQELRGMLQALLAERFHLAVRREEKRMPVYALEIGKNGSKIHKSAGDGPAGMRPVGGGLTFQNFSMGDFADQLANRPLRIDRPVMDKTGLSGTYDFTLKFAESAGELKSSLEGLERGEDGGPSIATVIEEQLGLRLAPERGSVEVLVIEHAERVPAVN